MSRQYLNLTAGAWRQLRRNWQLPPSPLLLWQTLGPGTVFSALTVLQRTNHSEQLARANLNGALIVLGYWRSGTTLLHELLSLDPRYSFPTTHACMNPHHFLMSEASVLARSNNAVQRPMDEMEVRPSSPQEDEFALLSLGARSPYEALLTPSHFAQALKLADPRDLTPPEEQRWRTVFLDFLRGVSVRGVSIQGLSRPIILKSPTHGFRLATLRELLPDARYVLIVRDPFTHFESVVRMWRRMFQTYSLEPLASDDQTRDDAIREAVLADRLRFESKLESGAAGLPANRFTTLTYESLAADPTAACERLYSTLELGDFESVRAIIAAEVNRRSGYRAQGHPPSGIWRERIQAAWAPIFTRYNYTR